MRKVIRFSRTIDGLARAISSPSNTSTLPNCFVVSTLNVRPFEVTCTYAVVCMILNMLNVTLMTVTWCALILKYPVCFDLILLIIPPSKDLHFRPISSSLNKWLIVSFFSLSPRGSTATLTML